MIFKIVECFQAYIFHWYKWKKLHKVSSVSDLVRLCQNEFPHYSCAHHGDFSTAPEFSPNFSGELFK